MKIRPRNQLRRYQIRTANFVVAHERSMLHLDMGLGKTISVLTAVAELLEYCRIHGVLVLAPRLVAETVWKKEAAAWAHTAHLRVCILRGSNKKLLARELLRPYDIWVANYEAIPWLVTQVNELFLGRGRHMPFDMLAVDESTRVKNPDGRRVACFYAENKNGHCLLDYFPRRVGLTGTPVPNGLWDLYGQYKFVDDGRSLETSQQVYQEKYFDVDPFTGRRSPKEGAKEKIVRKTARITLSMRAEDYLQLPDYVYHNIWVDLPDKIRAEYDRLEETLFAEFDHGALEIFNQASLVAKCRQLANGNLIDTETRAWHPIHDIKYEALDSIVEEASGQPVLASYVFRPDMLRMKARYEKRGLSVGYLGPGVSETESVQVVDRWNRGLYRLLLLHHASGGHGLNIQAGGHQIAWFGLDWPLEGWKQLNARLRRPGQRAASVIVHKILARATVDEAVLARLESKDAEQDDFRAAHEALRRYRNNTEKRKAA